MSFGGSHSTVRRRAHNFAGFRIPFIHLFTYFSIFRSGVAPGGMQEADARRRDQAMPVARRLPFVHGGGVPPSPQRHARAVQAALRPGVQGGRLPGRRARRNGDVQGPRFVLGMGLCGDNNNAC